MTAVTPINRSMFALRRLGRLASPVRELVERSINTETGCWPSERPSFRCGPMKHLSRLMAPRAIALWSRAAALFGIPIVRVRLPDDSQAVGDWLVDILKNAPDSLSVSPPLFDAVSDLPPADCLLFDVSDRLHVLRVRRNSTTERLVRQRLKDVPTPASTWLHQDTPDSAEFLRAEFRKHPGLIDWIVLDIEPPTAEPPSTASVVSARKTAEAIIPDALHPSGRRAVAERNRFRLHRCPALCTT